MWGEVEVSIVAMMAFSKDSREEFGELFEALIRVLSRRENVERLAGRAGKYEEFIRGCWRGSERSDSSLICTAGRSTTRTEWQNFQVVGRCC